SRSAMLLNASATARTAGGPFGGTRADRSPSATRSAAPTMSPIGGTMRVTTARNVAPKIPTTRAPPTPHRPASAPKPVALSPARLQKTNPPIPADPPQRDHQQPDPPDEGATAPARPPEPIDRRPHLALGPPVRWRLSPAPELTVATPHVARRTGPHASAAL